VLKGATVWYRPPIPRWQSDLLGDHCLPSAMPISTRWEAVERTQEYRRGRSSPGVEMPEHQVLFITFKLAFTSLWTKPTGIFLSDGKRTMAFVVLYAASSLRCS
jgi:hypothetical protein